MILNILDTNPGRCLNLRSGSDAYGYLAMKRCLDYEGHEGRCTFQDDPKPVDRSWSQTASHPTKPEPWVSPLHEQAGA